MHDEVEELVAVDFDGYMAILGFEGDLYSEEFLFTSDPYMQRVLQLSGE